MSLEIVLILTSFAVELFGDKLLNVPVNWVRPFPQKQAVIRLSCQEHPQLTSCVVSRAHRTCASQLRPVDGAETTNVVPPSNQTRPSTPVTVAVGVRGGIYQRPEKNIARSSDTDRPVEWQSWQEGCTDIQCVTGQT